MNKIAIKTGVLIHTERWKKREKETGKATYRGWWPFKYTLLQIYIVSAVFKYNWSVRVLIWYKLKQKIQIYLLGFFV